MQPFKLPDFYEPHSARLNPNLNAARAHTKAWAREMGILDTPQDENVPKIWDEHDLDGHDYALFCAYVHPDASISELNLMTDWNVWGFYVDDYFVQVYIQPKNKDYAGAKRYLDGMLSFMPVDLNLMPIPTNPTERGLADVWRRTASTKSEAWRRRIIESTRSLLEAGIWELDNMNRQRLSNPIEYIAARRKVGGALWSADLIEHTFSLEIPERIIDTRAMQALKNSFADAVHLGNDIFSYEREVLKEKQFTNGVLVVERFLGVDTQRAADLVNNIVTCQIRRFEQIVSIELPTLFDEYALDPIERANVLTYIRGLQDFRAGAHEWHIQTDRYLNPAVSGQISAKYKFLFYPTGLGTSGIHLATSLKQSKHVPSRQVGPTPLPNFYMPFKAMSNPHLETARKYSKQWAQQMGMFNPLPDHRYISIWDERRFDAGDLAFMCALAYPNATDAELNLNTCWMIWGTYADDYFPTVYGRTRNMAGAKVFYARLSEFMPIESGLPTPIPGNPVERSLADLWAQTSKVLSVDERRLFRKAVESMVGSWLWELSDQIQNRIPDPIDYIEIRRKTIGLDFILTFAQIGKGWQIPPDMYRTGTIQELNKVTCDHVWLGNDIISYQKEIEFEDEIHNVVLVIENFIGCDRIEAVRIANDLMTARIKQFEHIVAVELPALFENFNLDVNGREGLFAYIKVLQNYMSGALQWHIAVDRYKEFELHRSARRFTGASTGLGYSAMHPVAKYKSASNHLIFTNL